MHSFLPRRIRQCSDLFRPKAHQMAIRSQNRCTRMPYAGFSRGWPLPLPSEKSRRRWAEVYAIEPVLQLGDLPLELEDHGLSLEDGRSQ